MKLRQSANVTKFSWKNFIWIALLHVLAAAFAVQTFRVDALLLCVGLLYATAMFGVTFGFHRMLTHRSFKAPAWLENSAALFGTLACQGGPISWVGGHRIHHAYSDKSVDPHDATRGFFYSHFGWIVARRQDLDIYDEFRHYAPDLASRPFFRFLEMNMIPIQVALGLLLFVIGGLTGAVGVWDISHASSFVVWGVFVRLVASYHITWFVNSAAHKWGSNPNGLKDLSKNNWWVGLLAFGEGWHNNHHAQPRSARHGWHWWQFDQTWILISALERVGILSDVKRPETRTAAEPLGEPGTLSPLRSIAADVQAATRFGGNLQSGSLQSRSKSGSVPAS